MKIDKIVFSCSEPEEYSSFWNIQSKIYSSMGIEPTCLLFGKKSNTDMNENYGKILEVPIIESLPWPIQIVWSKFNFPTTEPNKTWIVGDIDLIPLQKNHFIDRISEYPEDYYLHLNPSQNFHSQGSEFTGGTNLPGHYHVAKGYQFNLFVQNRTFEEQVKYIVNSHRYGMGPRAGKPKDSAYNEQDRNAYWYYWLAEELYTSEILYDNIKKGNLKYAEVRYNNQNDTQRIDRTGWNNELKNYTYSEEKARNKQFVDIHCTRPYKKQKEAIEKIFSLTQII